jgi:DNA invertase Pin-like site-specific DNA recombinase
VKNTPPAPPLTSIAYIRVSTAHQVSDGDGLGVQREKIAAWCAYQDLPLGQVFEDAGISGSAEDRAGLRSALRAALQLGPAGVLVVYKLDRLGRNALDVQETLAVLLHGGVRVVSLADGIDSASGMGAALLKLLTSILATFAELEREGIKTRLLDGRRRADAQDRTYASEPRYGRRVADPNQRSLVVDDAEVAAVARAHELRAQGLTYRQIATQLDDEGHHPRRAARWSHVVVARICTGRRTPQKTHTTRRIARARAELLGP